MAPTYTPIPGRSNTVLPSSGSGCSILRHSEFQLANASKHPPKRSAKVRRADFLLQESDCQGVESLNVLFEALLREIRVTLKDVDDDWSPGYDVSLLSLFLEQDERANYISTESIGQVS
jgi:hypothetical protein